MVSEQCLTRDGNCFKPSKLIRVPGVLHFLCESSGSPTEHQGLVYPCCHASIWVKAVLLPLRPTRHSASSALGPLGTKERRVNSSLTDHNV